MKLNMRNYVSGADYGEVYRLFTNNTVNSLIINKPDHNSMGVFSKWFERHLETDFHDFMIFSTMDDDFVGFAYSYEFSEMDGYCLFTVAIKPEYQGTGVGGFAAVQFLTYLFANYNLRKVYIHIYEYNTHSRLCAETFGFSLEGTLKEHRFYRGTFNDLFIFSISRDGFDNIVHRLNLL